MDHEILHFFENGTPLNFSEHDMMMILHGHHGDEYDEEFSDDDGDPF